MPLHGSTTLRWQGQRQPLRLRLAPSSVTASAARGTSCNAHWLGLSLPRRPQSYSFSMLVLSLIFASTITFVLETVPAVRQSGSHVLFGIEAFCIAVFTLEVLLRLLSTPSCSGYFKDTFNWIDIVSIIPFYVELAIPASGASSIGLVRVVRLVRVARIVKVSRYSQSIRIFSSAMLSSLRPLMMLVFLVSIAMVMFSSGLYFAELTDDGCRAGGWTDETRSLAHLGIITCDPRLPEWTQLSSNGTFRFKQGATDVVLACVCMDSNPFQSIPATFWWCIVTMTTGESARGRVCARPRIRVSLDDCHWR